MKKARKSAALIIAEANISELKEDMKEIKSLLWKVGLGTLGGVASALGTLLLVTFKVFFHVPVNVGN